MKKLESGSKIELKAITETKEGYSVFLFQGCREDFKERSEAIEFLKEKSIQLNSFIHSLNGFYLEILNVCQPHITSLSGKQIREYTERRKNIDDQLCFILSQYHGGSNQIYFKKLDYIIWQMSLLLTVCEGVPEIFDKIKVLQTKTPQRLW